MDVATDWLFRTVSGDGGGRSDLVAGWFKFKEDACELALSRAKDFVYQGVDDSQTPESLVEKIDMLHVQIRFNYLLSERALEQQRPTWTGKNAISLATAVDRHIERMGEIVTAIDELLAFARKIKEDCRGFKLVPSSTGN